MDKIEKIEKNPKIYTYKAKYNKLWKNKDTGKVVGEVVEVKSHEELAKYTEVPRPIDTKDAKNKDVVEPKGGENA